MVRLKIKEVLLSGSIYQGAILVHVFEPQPHPNLPWGWVVVEPISALTSSQLRELPPQSGVCQKTSAVTGRRLRET